MRPQRSPETGETRDQSAELRPVGSTFPSQSRPDRAIFRLPPSQSALASPQTDSAIRHDPAQLEVSRIRALRGPNYWRLAPVIACDVRLGSLEKVTSADITGFTEKLTTAIPSLINHKCTRGKRGGFIERLKEGTHIPHILEHLAL